MADRADVCVLIPTLDEAETIGDVIQGLHDLGLDDVLVMDGGSSDDTREIARDLGARVETQTGSGKGQAVREAVARYVDADYVLMLDGDGTYHPEDAGAVLEPLLDGPYEHVVGNRFGDLRSGAMTRMHQFGNSLVNAAFRFIHGRDLADILSGYRAFTRASFERMNLAAEGFEIETEMAVECVKNDVPTTVVPVSYLPRPDESDANLRSFRDGARIFLTLYQLAKTNNPLFYFGSVGVLSSLVGVVVGVYVGVEWATRGVSHEILAVVAAFAVLFGVQLLMFGVLSDLIVSLHREQMRRIEDD
jgi:dolichol-phosphate mannosyltransferase